MTLLNMEKNKTAAMKRYLFLLPLLTAVIASCNKENPVGDANNALSYVEKGISIVASAEMTKVSVSPVGTEGAYTGSQMSWEVGDHITVFHDGKTYDFVTASFGTNATFYPVNDANVINSLNSSKPVIAYYNVASVAADGTGTFSVPASQTEGELSNKTPLYAYSPTPDIYEECLCLTFAPMVSVLEFKLSAAPASAVEGFEYNLTKLVLTPKSGASGWTVMTGGTINPATGEITPAAQSMSAITLNFSSPVNIAGGKHVQMIVGKCELNNTGATMDWYKGEVKHFTKDIWASKDIDFATYPVHAYQPIAEKVVGLANYNDYYTKFYANRNNQDYFINICDDERAIILTGDIIMTGGGGNRAVCFPALKWNFDGKGHCFYNINVTDAKQRIPGFFSNVQADIKNLVFGKDGYDSEFTISDLSNGGSYAPITDLTSGTIENVVSNINWTLAIDATNKTTYLGGIVGNMKAGTIKNCRNNGSLTVAGFVSTANVIAGGVAANVGNTASSIETSHNYGAVTVSGSSTGAIYCSGIAGVLWNGCNIIGCENHGNVGFTNSDSTDQSSDGNAQNRAAGIFARVGANQGAQITNCTNYGDITGSVAAAKKTFQVAGIVADFQQGSTATNCVERGSVSAYLAGEYSAIAACWFSVWCGGTVNSASVLEGIKVNDTTVGESNYNKRNIWSRNNDPGTLTLLKI